MSKFIPALHFEKPQEKLTPEWALKAIQYYYYNMDNKSLLHGKDIDEIQEFATGNIDMKKFTKIFKSIRRNLEKTNAAPNLMHNYTGRGGAAEYEFEPLSLIAEKINSAVAITSKIPVEVSCQATDPLAIEKREKDINFLKNKPYVEAELIPIADKLGIDDIDLGTTENSTTPFSESPFGLDLDNPDELEIFQNLIYSLKVETSFETVLQAFYDLKKADQIRKLEIKDQLYYGVSAHRTFESPITGLPDIEYIFPADIRVPYSRYEDFRDVSHIIRDMRVTPMELFSYFGDEIKDKAQLEKIVNEKGSGYCACNNVKSIDAASFDTYKMDLKYFEVKSIDYIGTEKSKHKKGYKGFTDDDGKTEKKNWAQNTYCFYWLTNTNYIFKVHRLGFAHREKGKESYQNFSIDIYKSQEKGAVELAIGENKKAIIADIKMQFAVLKSLPAGRYIDLRFLRNALSGISDPNDKDTMQSLINLALEDNVMIGDTEGLNGKNDGQFKPVIDLAGGLKSEVTGYMTIIADANRNISRITGINEQLVGTSANPEGLVGMQKLLINSSINALYYINEALESQYQSALNVWASIVKGCIERGGVYKQAIIDIIGSRKVSIIDDLDDINLHDIGVIVKINQREEERAAALQELIRMKNLGMISAADSFLFDNIRNPKDKYAFLAVKEQKYKEEQAAQQEANFINQQQLVQQAGQNQIAAQQAKTEGEVNLVYAKGDVQSKILQLASQLGLSSQEYKAVADMQLQRERNKAQRDKNIEVLQAKSNIEQQEAMV